MKERFTDLTNQRFGRLVVLERAENDKHSCTCWVCKCDCGNIKTIRGNALRRGLTVSCGCYHKEDLTNRLTTHNASKTRLFREWQYMKRRCYNPNYKFYSYYGARGITMCDEWKNNFVVFQQWALSNGYTDKLTLDRIDTNGNYEPSNCRWVTRKVQQNNNRRNLNFTINGETKTLAQWCEIYDVPHERTRSRVVNRGWNILDALTTPAHKKPN